MKYLVWKLSFFLITTISISACASLPISLGEQQVNATLFENPQDLQERVATFEPGMSETEVFSILGISRSTPNLEWLDDITINTIQNYNAQMTGVPAEIEAYRQSRRLKKQTGIQLPYRFVEDFGYLDTPLNIVTKSTGFDLRLVVIFEDDELVYWKYPVGTENVETMKSFSIIGKAFHAAPSHILGAGITGF